MASFQLYPVQAAEEDNISSVEDFKSPPIRTWKKFPPRTVDRVLHHPDSASTPYNQQLHRIDSLGVSPLRHLKRRNLCALSPIDRLKLGVKRRNRELCKSFELNQTCPTKATATSPFDAGAPRDDNVAVVPGTFWPTRDTDVSLSSIYSSGPSSSSSNSNTTKSINNHSTASREFSRVRVVRKRAVMEKIRVDGANGLRFSARRTKGCFVSSGGSGACASSGGGGVTSSSATGNSVPGSAQLSTNTATTTTTTTTTNSDSLMRFSKSEMNPNKAVFTIDSKTSRILIVNKNACDLLGYSSKELCEIEFSDLLLVNKTKSHVSALAEGQLNSEDGTLVLLSGKVVEMCTKSGTNLAVSLWIRQIDTDGRCLAVAEPVERRIARIQIDGAGAVTSADYEALLLFQMDSVEEFGGLHVTNLIPAIKLPEVGACESQNGLPKSVYKQKATGRTKDGLAFPLCLTIERCEGKSIACENGDESGGGGDDGDQKEPSAKPGAQFTVTVFVFNNLSGLMVIDESGIIESCNHHFSMLMFGYAQAKIIGQHVSKVIPNFGQEFADLSRSRNATISSLDNEESETETDHVERTDLTVSDRLSSCADNAKMCLDFNTSKVNSSMVSELSDDISNIKSLSSDTRSLHGQSEDQGGGGTAAGTTTTGAGVTGHLAKSLSENLLCHENHENNRNLANSIRAAAATTTTNTYDNTYEDEYSQLMDNEILTPVNETDYYVNNDAILPPSANLNASSERNSIVVNDNSTASLSCGKGESVNNDLSHEENVSVSGGSQQQQVGKRQPMHIQDGKYKGEAVHNDGNVIDIIYTVSCQTLPSGRVHCVWVSRDPDTELNSGGKGSEDALAEGEMGEEGEEDDGEEDDDEEEEEEERNQNLTLTFDSVNSTVENSLGHAIKTTAQNTTTTTTTGASASNANVVVDKNRSGAAAVPGSSSRPNSMSLLSQCEEELIAGEFSRHYATLKQIGKGAYGYVKMAYRKADHLLVIAKFILKEKLCPQFMVMTEDKREVPMEIYLLTTVEHPNIVSVLDVFENDKFYQLVMEKHGCGMDLFEFIDRLPMMDEKLACYIFRQIANAVEYLHSLHILHRDLKDENIIIDQNFHVKLIDFGSATFMEEGKLFSTFYGTTEYCSPEVLAGNKYAGPELEMWSLGVTLYVIMFFENPFVDIEETLHGTLVIPQKVSDQLERLLFSMLDKSPLTRCTIGKLMADPWLNQEINPVLFNFAWVVPCEAFESNPEKYYHGQVLSSGTAISTNSPQDSLSLVDGDSMLDADVEDGARELELDEDVPGSECEFEAAEEERKNGMKDGWVPTATVIKVIEPNATGNVRNAIRTSPIKRTSFGGGGKSLPKNNSPAISISGGGMENNAQDVAAALNTIPTGGRNRGLHSSSSRRKSQRKVMSKKAHRNCEEKMIMAKEQKSEEDDKLCAAPLAISKSENNLFEKSCTEGGYKLFAGYEGVMTSMRDLQFETSPAHDPTRTMNDLSRTQVLNTLAVSRETMPIVRSEEKKTATSCLVGDIGEGGGGGLTRNMSNSATENRDWTATVELTPKSSNRSNFQILSISYTGGSDVDGDLGVDNDGYDEDGYENDSWDEDEDEEDLDFDDGRVEEESARV